MELAAQIKKHRNAPALSQEQLAEKIFVTRQTVSNWENDKTYPDINSLLRLSELFCCSVDELIKGDVCVMKSEINEQEIAEYRRDSNIFAALFVLMLFLPIPLSEHLGWVGWGIWAVIFAVCFYYGLRLERYKKKHNLHTFKEIIAFTEGKSLSEIEQAREKAKWPYQRILLALGCGLLGIAVSALMASLF